MGNVQQNGHQSSETKHEKLVDENTSRQEQNENQNEENGKDLIDEKLNMNEGTWEMRKCCVVKILTLFATLHKQTNNTILILMQFVSHIQSKLIPLCLKWYPKIDEIDKPEQQLKFEITEEELRGMYLVHQPSFP